MTKNNATVDKKYRVYENESAKEVLKLVDQHTDITTMLGQFETLGIAISRKFKITLLKLDDD